MPNITHVTVTAPEGRRTPVYERDGVEPGGGPLYVESDFVVTVGYSHTTIRSINRGDLVLCDMNGAAVASAELASSIGDLQGIKTLIKRAAVAAKTSSKEK